MALDRIGDGLALRSKGDIVSHDGTNPIVLNVGTTGQILYAQSSATAGVQWQTTPTAETQYIEVIASTYLSASTTTVSFTDIPGTYKDIYFRWAVQTTTGDELKIRVNSLTANSSHRVAGPQTAASGTTGRYDAVSPLTVHNTYLNSQDSGQSFSPGYMTIYQYANTTYHKNGESHGGYQADTYPFVKTSNISIHTTSAITRVDFHAGGNNINAGSHFTLYGIKES